MVSSTQQFLTKNSMRTKTNRTFAANGSPCFRMIFRCLCHIALLWRSWTPWNILYLIAFRLILCQIAVKRLFNRKCQRLKKRFQILQVFFRIRLFWISLKTLFEDSGLNTGHNYSFDYIVNLGWKNSDPFIIAFESGFFLIYVQKKVIC